MKSRSRINSFYLLTLPIQAGNAEILHRPMLDCSVVYFNRHTIPENNSSQSNHQLIVPPVKLSTYGLRSFAVSGPTIWNNLPEYIRDPELSMDNFRRHLTWKLCYRKEDRAMRPIYGCSEKFREFLTTPTATITEIFNGLCSDRSYGCAYKISSS